jgi:hypothetical protein
MLSCIYIFALNGGRTELMEFDQEYAAYKYQQMSRRAQPLSMLMWAVTKAHIVGTEYALTQDPKLTNKETVRSEWKVPIQPHTPREFAKKIRGTLQKENPLYDQFCKICVQLRHAEEERDPTFVQKQLPSPPKSPPETEFMFGEDDMDWEF